MKDFQEHFQRYVQRYVQRHVQKFCLRSKSLRLVALGCVLAVGVYLWPALIFYPMGCVLSRDNHPRQGADFVMLLMGEASLRPQAAAKAVLAGISDQVLFVSTQSNPLVGAGLIASEDDLTLAMLKRSGLGLDHVSMISEFGRATSTYDEAVAIKKYFEAKSIAPKRLVIVTSWPHASRAGWILEKALQKMGTSVELLPVDQIPFERSNWWQSEGGLLFVFEEYVKWGRYLVKYLGRDIS
jgi:uncharacterized SAM-binding protein YcdF (DUF218 family)